MAVLISDNVTQSMIDNVYNDDYIISRISTDDSIPSFINHPLITYYSVFFDDTFLGLILCLRYNKYEIEMHSLLKKDSIPYSREIGRLIINKMFLDSDVLRISAPVQSDLKSTMNFLEKIGFVKEGIKKDAIIKKGIITDMIMYGILKSNYKELQ